jgi:hypothetical protein
MSQPISYFEIHVGFPDGDRYDQGSREFAARLAGDALVWTVSEVTNVLLNGCLDPHNVPGRLRWLVSTRIENHGGDWSEVIARQVLPACDRALALLAQLNLPNTRLEVEYPYGCCWTEESTRKRSIEPATLIAPKDLVFRHGRALEHVPQWEIHYVLEPGAAAKDLTIGEVGKRIEQYGPNIEQTIEYRSQSMAKAGAHKFIATSYYDSHEDTVQEAQRLYLRSNLSDEFKPYGFTLKLVLEHIVGCFQPVIQTPESHSIEVQNAR